MSGSPLETTLYWQIQAAGLVLPEREVALVPARKWRWDFVWRAQRLAVECDGGIFTQGAHARIWGILRDIEKGNAATLAGYRTLRVTGPMIADGSALTLIETALTGGT